MTFCGNDILVLNTENLRTFSRKGAGRHILSEAEQSFSKNEISPAELMWRWTCKEAAYKILMKKGERNAFTPAHFEVVPSIAPAFQPGEKISGTIIWDDQNLSFYTVWTENYIFTQAFCDKDVSEYSSSIFLSEITPEILGRITGNNNAIIRKTIDNVPILTSSTGEILNLDISITNDYGYTAITLLQQS